jgi:hypothetical protein
MPALVEKVVEAVAAGKWEVELKPHPPETQHDRT